MTFCVSKLGNCRTLTKNFFMCVCIIPEFVWPACTNVQMQIVSHLVWVLGSKPPFFLRTCLRVGALQRCSNFSALYLHTYTFSLVFFALQLESWDNWKHLAELKACQKSSETKTLQGKQGRMLQVCKYWLLVLDPDSVIILNS